MTCWKSKSWAKLAMNVSLSVDGFPMANTTTDLRLDAEIFLMMDARKGLWFQETIIAMNATRQASRTAVECRTIWCRILESNELIVPQSLSMSLVT